LAEGRDEAVRRAGVNAERLLAEGQALTLDQARLEALRLVDQVAPHATAIETR
jgi:hypothetical protein